MNLNLLPFVIIILLLPLASATTKIPAMYVFGDSLIDSGNNNHLPGISSAQFLPFGIDFGQPTGRCTNGKTVADYLAVHLGLPFVPPYLGLSKNQKNKISTGINYASAGSGILPETNNMTSLTLDKQIMYFKRTMKNNLPTMFNESELKKHLSQSLFFVSTGVNDYFHNGIFRGSKKFAAYLLNEFLLRLQEFYSLGARKFFVNNIPPAGCFPSKAARSRPRGKCVDKINRAISFYNKVLPDALLQLQSLLPGFTFVHSDLNGILMELRETGYKYGIVETWKPCCPNSIYSDMICHPYNVTCPDRNTHLFFDDHPSQIANQIYARHCFHEKTICFRSGLKLL